MTKQVDEGESQWKRKIDKRMDSYRLPNVPQLKIYVNKQLENFFIEFWLENYPICWKVNKLQSLLEVMGV